MMTNGEYYGKNDKRRSNKYIKTKKINANTQTRRKRREKTKQNKQ